MGNLLEHVETSIRERKLFRRGEHVLIAVSGGLDSITLLHALHALAPTHRWRLTAAHFNHQLRGRASDADESFVRATAKRFRLPFVAGRANVKLHARRHGLSVEMAARQLRHEFLAQCARKMRCPTIALAQHADDQVELFFLRLLRGAGGEGLAGMKWRSPSPVEGWDPAFNRCSDESVRSRLKAGLQTQLVRPLLDVSRGTLEQFARKHSIRFREDASNASRAILRNRIRHELLPLLRRRFQPALTRTVLRVMDIVGTETETVSAAAQVWLGRPVRGRRLRDGDVALQRRVVQVQLQQLRIEPSFDLIETLRLAPGEPVTVAQGLRVACDAAGTVSAIALPSKRFAPGEMTLGLEGKAGEISFGGARFKWRIVGQAGARLPKAAAFRECFDADKVGPRLILRHWRPGDRFQPIGMDAAMKLQDFFTNQKLAADRRRRLILATTAWGEVFWVEGQRIGAACRLTGHTKKRLNWAWERLQPEDCVRPATMLAWPDSKAHG